MDRRELLQRLETNKHNVSFTVFVDLLEGFGFRLLRIRGGHHMFRKPGLRELVNIQPRKGEAKPYQIQQFLGLVERYNLKLEEDQ